MSNKSSHRDGRWHHRDALSPHHENLARTHFSTKSRSYSTTLGALRAARRAWRTEQARIRASLPEPEPDTTLVIANWAYLGSGYSPGAGLLAAAVWHRRELARQFAAEGGC